VLSSRNSLGDLTSEVLLLNAADERFGTLVEELAIR